MQWRYITIILTELLVLVAGKTDEHTDDPPNVIAHGLYHKLFANYDPQLLPICENDEKVNVTFDLALRQIIRLDEKEQLLTTNVWLRVKWNDCRFRWTNTNISRLVVPYDKVWTPRLTLYDSSAEEEMMPGREDHRVVINPDGAVEYKFPTVIKSVCRVEVAFFPFDIQNCTLKFGPWTHTTDEVDLYPSSEDGDLESFVPNNEWYIRGLSAVRTEMAYPESGGNFSDVSYNITMERRPVFYVITMIFPCMLTTAIATIGFLLPSESGEKVSLEVTVLLSMAVFLLVISDFLPPSAEQFPIIGTYFASSMILVGFSLVLSVLILNVHHRGDNGKDVPRWAKKLFLRGIGRCCFTSIKQSDPIATKYTKKQQTLYAPNTHEDSESCNGDIKLTETTQSFSSAAEAQIHILKLIEKHMVARELHDQVCDDWKQLARVLDRLALFLYILLSIIVGLVFLSLIVSR